MAISQPAKFQTLEAIYELVKTAATCKQPIVAIYHGRKRLLCPHRLGWNKEGRPQALCYQYGGESRSGLESEGSPANWRCVALEMLSRVELLEGSWRTAPNHSRPQSCVARVDVDAEDQPDRDPQNGQ
jgi:hypothetical protein